MQHRSLCFTDINQNRKSFIQCFVQKTEYNCLGTNIHFWLLLALVVALSLPPSPPLPSDSLVLIRMMMKRDSSDEEDNATAALLRRRGSDTTSSHHPQHHFYKQQQQQLQLQQLQQAYTSGNLPAPVVSAAAASAAASASASFSGYSADATLQLLLHDAFRTNSMRNMASINTLLQHQLMLASANPVSASASTSHLPHVGQPHPHPHPLLLHAQFSPYATSPFPSATATAAAAASSSPPSVAAATNDNDQALARLLMMRAQEAAAPAVPASTNNASASAAINIDMKNISSAEQQRYHQALINMSLSHAASSSPFPSAVASLGAGTQQPETSKNQDTVCYPNVATFTTRLGGATSPFQKLRQQQQQPSASSGRTLKRMPKKSKESPSSLLSSVSMTSGKKLVKNAPNRSTTKKVPKQKSTTSSKSSSVSKSKPKLRNKPTDTTKSGSKRPRSSTASSSSSITVSLSSKPQQKLSPVRELSPQPPPSASSSRRKDSKWIEQFEELVSYKESQGDTLVPRGYKSNPKLASWVAEQRKQYKLRTDGKSSCITTERIGMLNSIGFAWNAQEAAWERQVASLTSFRRQHGHSNVPVNEPNFPKLGLWVKEQRRHYTLWKQGRPSHMTEERVKQLTSLGFCWDTHENIWLQRLEELASYKKEHGDCLVPTTYAPNPKLATWVHHQRRQYKRFVDGKDCHITSDRIEALERLGFAWNPRDQQQAAAAAATSGRTSRSTSPKIRSNGPVVLPLSGGGSGNPKDINGLSNGNSNVNNRKRSTISDLLEAASASDASSVVSRSSSSESSEHYTEDLDLRPLKKRKHSTSKSSS